MKIQVSNPGWDGMVSIALDGKLLCTDYDQGILLLAGQNFIERTSEIDVYPVAYFQFGATKMAQVILM
ncbi:hypothetical protein NXV73_10305 [Bacteroides salyersiae]|nr:hypothetical protein [Bacteroides salyersiae]